MTPHDCDRRLLAAMHRIRQRDGQRGPIASLDRLRGKLAHALWNHLGGCDVARGARIARSARFPHLTGVVIHRDAVVEDGCMIMQQVTLGQTALDGAPHVCRGAYVGAGAKILGAVTIGAGARVGANAVVLADVPPGATAVGVPARIVRRCTGDGSAGEAPDPVT